MPRSGLVAQGIEHRSPKAGVAGSNPAGATASDQESGLTHGSIQRSVGMTMGMNPA